MSAKYFRILALQFVFTLILFFSFLYILVKYDSNQLQTQVNTIGQTLSFAIQEDVNISEGVLSSFAYNYEIDPDLDKSKFELLAKHYIKENSKIIYIQRKDENTITTMVYPETYNYTLGATLLGRPEVEEAVIKAITDRTVTANAPFILQDTEDLVGLVIRYPLYKEDVFTGFFVVVMNVDNFLKGVVSAETLENYNVSLFDDKENLFWGYDGLQEGYIYRNKIYILDNFWTIQISMKRNMMASTIEIVTVSSILFILIVGLLVEMQVRLYKKDQNIQHLASLKKELERVKASYSLALESANDALWEWNIITGEIFTSEKWLKITGNETLGQGIETILHKGDIHPEDYDQAVHALELCLAGERTTFDSTYRILDHLGNYSWVQNRGKVYENGRGVATVMAGSITNIDDRKQRETKIEYMAYYDALTGLANKQRFLDMLEIELNKIVIEGKKCSVLMIDLDNFKRLNDTLGLDFCDQLLKHIGDVISLTVGDEHLTARFGGDEFLILLRNQESRDKVEAICINLVDIFRRPFELEDKSIYITASIGVVCCLNQRNSISEYMRNVDMALNKAKESGKNQYCFFDSTMHSEILRNSEIESCIRRSIQLNTLKIHYQLQQGLVDERITGIEALARLSDEVMGDISPLEFIQVAEATGLIVPLGNWILENACMQGKAWLDEGYQFGKLSVNISAFQLYNAEFYDDVKAIINKTKFPADWLELEITETALFIASNNNLGILQRLKSLGIKFALDDFGTGYSSLNYLTVMPIDTLKIDKSFVDKASENIRETYVIKSIIELAHSLNLNVVAEGVETFEQREMLKQMACNSIQGYFFARPMAASDIKKYFERLISSE